MTLSKVDDEILQLEQRWIIQVERSIYTLQEQGIEWTYYSGLDSGQVLKMQKADAPAARNFPCLINFRNEAVFVCGGRV